MNLATALETVKVNTLPVDGDNIAVKLDNKDNPSRKKAVMEACKVIGEAFTNEKYVSYIFATKK